MARPRRTALDDTDRALLSALEHDARASNISLAQSIGVSEKTVRLRLQRLIGEHGLTFHARLPGAASKSRLLCLIHAAPTRRISAAEDLLAEPQVEQLYLASGAADIVVIAAFTDDTEALRFLVDIVEAHPLIESVQSCHLISDSGGRDGRVPRINQSVLSMLTIASPPQTGADEILATICDATIAGLGADRVAIARGNAPLPGAPADAIAEMFAVARRGFDDGYFQAAAERIRRRNHGVIQQVWESRVHVAVADAVNDPLTSSMRDLVKKAGYSSLLALPMLNGADVTAVVCLYFDQPTTFSARYIATAQQVVDFYSLAFARAVANMVPSG